MKTINPMPHLFVSCISLVLATGFSPRASGALLAYEGFDYPDGRDLSAGANTSVSLNLVPPGSLYLDRLNQVDLRFSKDVRLGPGTSLKGMVGLYNALNANTIQRVNNSFGTTGASWLEPDEILPGRLIKFEAQLNF